MNASKEEFCIAELGKICEGDFKTDKYSLDGPKECAVCIEKSRRGWGVYEKEKNSYNDSCLFDNVVEACLDFLKRMSPASDYKRLKWEFLDSIIAQKSA